MISALLEEINILKSALHKASRVIVLRDKGFLEPEEFFEESVKIYQKYLKEEREDYEYKEY